MAKICNINFWIGNDPPPPFGTFPKKHPFWCLQSSLSVGFLAINQHILLYDNLYDDLAINQHILLFDYV